MANFERAMAFLQSGTYQPGTLEYKHWDYYDRAVMVSTTQKYQFFMVPNGQGGKQTSDTNFPIAGQMPDSERMAVMYLGFSFFPDELMAQATFLLWKAVLVNSYIEVSIHNKSPMLQLPLHAAFGEAMPAIITGAAAGDHVMGRTQIHHIYPLDIEIPLQAKATFKIEWIHDAAPNAALDDYELYIHMIGPRWHMS